MYVTEVPKCDCCDNPATCTFEEDGRGCFMCDDCCAHSGEEGGCYDVLTGEQLHP